MNEPPVISNAKSRRTAVLIWAVGATVLAFVATAVAVFFFLETRELHIRLAGWIRWETSTGGNGHWYKAVSSTDGVTWTKADTLARAEGGYLTTITSEAENAFVFNLINSPMFFIGPNGFGPALGGFQSDMSAEPDGGWCWRSGEPWNYTNWRRSEPNNAYDGSEDKLHFCSGKPGMPAATWNDVRNDLKLGGYVIERSH